MTMVWGILPYEYIPQVFQSILFPVPNSGIKLLMAGDIGKILN